MVNEEGQEETTGEQSKSSQADRLKPWQYKKGQSGNPSGRPEGISMKEYIRKNFRHMTDEQREEYLNGMDKKDILEMAEGKPHSTNDITSGGKPIPILNVLGNNSNPTDSEVK